MRPSMKALESKCWFVHPQTLRVLVSSIPIDNLMRDLSFYASTSLEDCLLGLGSPNALQPGQSVGLFILSRERELGLVLGWEALTLIDTWTKH